MILMKCKPHTYTFRESRISVPEELMAQAVGRGLGHERVESAKFLGPLHVVHSTDSSKKPCRCSDGFRVLIKENTWF